MKSENAIEKMFCDIVKPLNVEHDELVEEIKSAISLEQLKKVTLKVAIFTKKPMSIFFRQQFEIRLRKKAEELTGDGIKFEFKKKSYGGI